MIVEHGFWIFFIILQAEIFWYKHAMLTLAWYDHSYLVLKCWKYVTRERQVIILCLALSLSLSRSLSHTHTTHAHTCVRAHSHIWQDDNFPSFFASRRGEMEKSPKAEDFPVAQVVYSFLKENISSSFSFAVWNKGRIICQRVQLKKLLSELELFSGQSEEHQVIKLTNTPLPLPLSMTSTSTSRRDQNSNTDTQNFTRRREELVPSAAWYQNSILHHFSLIKGQCSVGRLCPLFLSRPIKSCIV